MTQRFSSGAINGWLVATIGLSVTTIAASGFLVWALINYIDQRDNVDAKVATAVAEEKKLQADELEAKFLEREKEPNRQFVGPEDYGRLTFDYPKTWSVYIAKDESSSSYEAYLNPISVPPVSSSTQYALRVLIEDRDYDRELDSYQSKIRSGDLTSSTVKINGENGTRFDGNFSNDIRGSAVVFKIRDKTVTLRSDADTFKGDFDALVASITYNK